MKKTIAFLLIFSTVLFSGCTIGNKNGCSRVMMDLLEKKIISGDFFIYTDSNDITLDGYIASEKLSLLYYGKNQPLSELSLVVCFCVGISKAKECNEIHIYKVKNISDSFAIERMLKTRAEYLIKPKFNQNNSEYFTKSPSEYKLICKENYVMLFVGNDAENTADKITKYL